jgi:hypothetical protein
VDESPDRIVGHPRDARLVVDVLGGGQQLKQQRELMAERWQTAFNSAAYAINATALFLIAAAIIALQRAQEYFEQKEYAWLVPGATWKGLND